MDPLLQAALVALVGVYLAFLGKIIWDWFKSGRTEKGVYMTIEAFERHKKECCIIELKRSFNQCQQESCTTQANHESRIQTVEERLREGQATFLAINDRMDEKFDLLAEKFDMLNVSIAGIQATLKYALDRERKEQGF